MDATFVRYVPMLLRGEPELRDPLFRYYVSLGYSPGRYAQLRRYILDECVDDASLFGACKALVEWEMPKSMGPAVVDLALKVAAPNDVVRFVSAIWLLAKYGSGSDIEDFVRTKSTIWRRNWFAARQVAAVSPRLSSTAVARLSDELRDSGQLEAIRVLANLASLRRQGALTNSDRFYLVPTKFRPPYPFPKILIARAILSGRLPATQQAKLRADILALVKDPISASLLMAW